MELIDSLQKTYSQTKFWVIAILVSVVSVLLLPEIWRDLQSSTQPSDTLWKAALLVIALFGVCLLPFAAWHHYQRNKFFTWLRTNWSAIEIGLLHPDGYRLDLDTPLVKYTAVFSAILATVSFESRPFVHAHRGAGSAQVIFSLLTVIFGWWYFGGIDGLVSTTKALASNLRSKDTFTLRQLLEQ